VSRRHKSRSSGEPTNFALAEPAAFDDARALALEIARGTPARGFDAMSAGLVLIPGETVFRCVGAWLAAQVGASWAPPNWAQAVVTDQRLLCKCDDGRLLSLFWAEVSGLQIVLEQQRLALNYGDHAPIAFIGIQTAVLAVAAVAGVYGAPSLLTHPALSPLRYRVSVVDGLGNCDGRS
jgi:hypothetical protein